MVVYCMLTSKSYSWAAEKILFAEDIDALQSDVLDMI